MPALEYTEGVQVVLKSCRGGVMKTILVPVEQLAFMRSVLDAALLVAQRFGSLVEGLALGPDVANVMAFDVPPEWTTLSEQQRQDVAERSRQRFESFMLSCAIPRDPEASEDVSYSWIGQQVYGDSQIGSVGRVFDLIVLGRPQRSDEPPRMATVEAALFESGRPVLLVPPSSSGTIGDTIVIAWNRSTETARTVALAMPFLLKAQRVIVLTIEGWAVDGPTCEAILEYAAELHADLLIKGAYTQSRLRQMIFGGATSHILAHAKLPVVMAH
jgi:hypothetical protein